MRTLLITLTLVLSTLRASAQQDFMNVFVSTMSFQGSINELASGNLLVGMAVYPGATLLGPSGNVIHSGCYAGSTYSVGNMASLRRYASNEFVFATRYRTDSCDSNAGMTVWHTYPALGRMDTLGNVLDLRYYDLNGPQCSYFGGDVCVTEDSSIVVWGPNADFYAMRTDPSGAPLWARSFGAHGGFQFIKELPGGDLLAGINMDTAGAVVARMDANGNFLWCKSYMRPKGMVHDAIIESDSSFVITGFTDSTNLFAFIPLPADFQPKLFMMKLNGAGDVQWCKGYDSDPYHWYTSQWSRIERTLDGQYAVLATLGEQGYNFFYRPFLMKTDLNGDTLWTRSHGKTDFIYYTRDFLACSDGGFMFSGGIWGNLPDNNSGLPYIYKTDSLGNFSCSQRVHTVQVSDLFPSDSSFTLTSIDGATMYPAFVNDTLFDPIVVYDGCTFSTGFDPTRSRNLKVRPNPTAGRVTVEFADPLMAESYYSVYDAMGKLLYQRPLPTGATTEQIDLSRFGKGTYVIKFTDPEGVRHERVVLE